MAKVGNVGTVGLRESLLMDAIVGKETSTTFTVIRAELIEGRAAEGGRRVVISGRRRLRRKN